MFYLVIFRQSEIGLDVLREAKISAIVFSKFNPLGSCVPAIANKFCDVMKENEIAYCHGILEKVENYLKTILFITYRLHNLSVAEKMFCTGKCAIVIMRFP